MCKQVKSCSEKILSTKYSFRNLWLNVYTYRQNLALNNLQRLIRHKTQTTNNQHRILNEAVCVPHSSNTLQKSVQPLSCLKYGLNITTIGKLNGVVGLVTGFEELSCIMSYFWSRNRMNRVIKLFNEQDLRRADVVILSSAVSTWGLSPLFFKLGKSKWFHFFLLYGLFCLFLESLWLLYSLGWELSSQLTLCKIKCHILIDLFCLGITKYTLYEIRCYLLLKTYTTIVL